MSELLHGVEQTVGADSLGVCCVVCRRFRLSRAAVAGEVGAHHGETTVDQVGRDTVPGRRGPRVAMQQQHRRAVAGETNEQLQIGCVDHLLGEAVEHGQSLASRAPVARKASTKDDDRRGLPYGIPCGTGDVWALLRALRSPIAVP